MTSKNSLISGSCLNSSRNFIEKIDAGGFPSLHAMRATVLGGVVGLFFGSLAVWVLVCGSIVLVALSRVLLRHHYGIDVLAGVVFGVILVGVAAIFL